MQIHLYQTVDKSFNTTTTHLALQLPEIVGHILSFLVHSTHHEDTESIIKSKLYKDIHSCLFVNSLWHDCASRILWRHVLFEDTKTDYMSFLKFACTISNTLNLIVQPKPIQQQPSFLFYKRKIYKNANSNHTMRQLKQQFDLKLNSSFKQFFPKEDDDSIIFNSRSNHHSSPSSSSIIQNRNAIRSFTLKKIKEKRINEPLEHIGQYMPKLEKLDFYICDHVSDKSLFSFINHNAGHLTYLSLAGCNRITDDAILSVAQHCSKLEHLDLRACGHISDVSIKAIAHQCPELRHLNVGRVRDREKITIQSIRWIAILTKIAVLGLAGCDMTDECMVLLAKMRGSGLERISVNNCYQLTNKTIQAFVRHCPYLTVFEMKECHWINDWQSVAELAKRKVLLTLCEQQNQACVAWARRTGRSLEVRAPIK
ncbi:uncharacterized protein BX663DRAFT_510841 [Cokeromyces recurvatus]|uniref:uncharacterized protein n=1 Tax=Cokeromyces recurvatus TaxID=90255 RepID=UPI00221FB4B9|nr:uncharacterized protein BX663DRAFT_510841 [Cokeromyces recurvatus]KAI7902354.1 hypothetical protein BX663DRAFT_510841 [Cokeromyces recurvatus]